MVNLVNWTCFGKINTCLCKEHKSSIKSKDLSVDLRGRIV